VKLKILIGLVIFHFFGCQSVPKKNKSPVIEISSKIMGQWEARALISNLDSKESQIVQLDIINQGSTNIRVEVSTSMGFHLASFVIKEKHLQYILPKLKSYYDGPMSEEAFRPVLKINLDPRLVLAAIANTTFSDWSCQEENGRLVQCSTKNKQKIEWEYLDQSPLKKVKISDSKFEVQVAFKSYKNKESINDKTFNLKFPSDYKLIR
jgi:hypothetical protein